MTVSHIIDSLGLEAVEVPDPLREVAGGYTSDLLSDVMGNAGEDQALITIQAHKNTIAVATLIGSPLIIICNNRDIPSDMLSAAQKEGIALARTSLSQFEVSGRLYQSLN